MGRSPQCGTGSAKHWSPPKGEAGWEQWPSSGLAGPCVPEGRNTNTGIFSGQRHGAQPPDDEVCVQRGGREQASPHGRAGRPRPWPRRGSTLCTQPSAWPAAWPAARAPVWAQ